MTNLNAFALQRKVERMLNLRPEQIYCDDFAQDVSLEERASRRAKRNSKVLGEVVGYYISNKETREERYIRVKDHKIMYDNNCKGCVIYNKESGEQRIVSQAEFEQAYYKWGENKATK